MRKFTEEREMDLRLGGQLIAEPCSMFPSLVLLNPGRHSAFGRLYVLELVFLSFCLALISTKAPSKSNMESQHEKTASY